MSRKINDGKKFTRQIYHDPNSPTAWQQIKAFFGKILSKLKLDS